MEKLEPYLALAEQAKNDNDVLSVIDQALSDHDLFLYARLLFVLQTISLREPGNFTELTTLWLRILHIFAWGTWREYHDTTPRLPQLNPIHNAKLRTLTLMNELIARPRTSNQQLLYVLGLNDEHELMDLIDRAKSQELLVCETDGEGEATGIHVRRSLDLRNGELLIQQTLYDRLKANCDSTVRGLELQIADIRRHSLLLSLRRQALSATEATNQRQPVQENTDQASPALKIGEDPARMVEEIPENRERPMLQSTIGIRRAAKRTRDGTDAD